jgi:hypothetical protein
MNIYPIDIISRGLVFLDRKNGENAPSSLIGWQLECYNEVPMKMY